LAGSDDLTISAAAEPLRANVTDVICRLGLSLLSRSH